MPSRHTQRPAVERGAHPTDLGARLTDELAAVVAGARRRAVRDGDRQVDTAHLLHTLLESDPEVLGVFDGPQAARLLGYLVQRAIGYGLRWRGTVEDSGAGPMPSGSEGWSPAAASAMYGAHARAECRGDTCARGLDLLAAIAADPGSRAVEVLGRSGVDARVLAVRIDAVAVVEGCAAGRGGEGAGR